jgi:exosortase/archaeosortase family protein
MHGLVNTRAGLAAAQLLVYYPTWKWYFPRILDQSDEPWSLLALAVAFLTIGMHRREDTAESVDLLTPSLLIVTYALTLGSVPSLVQAAIAFTALGCTLTTFWLGVRFHVPTLGLLLLSLPVIPSFQFYLGYPMRVVSGSLSALLLQFGGLAVVRDGVALRWGSELVSIDAPCSGVKMLWAGLFLAFAIAAFLRLSPWRTVLVAIASVCTVLLGNVWRSAALFYMETGIIPMPEWCHDAAGVVVFVGVALFIAWFGARLSPSREQVSVDDRDRDSPVLRTHRLVGPMLAKSQKRRPSCAELEYTS